MITANIIQKRLELFWGYGNFEAPVWFVGMEEGLGKNTSVKELEARFVAADGKMTVDMRRDMAQVPDHIRFFKESAPVQASWKYPIALYLYLKNRKEPSKQDIRDYQMYMLGDSELKNDAAIELMPLPSHKANEDTWIYDKYGIFGLGSRSEYLNAYKPKRVRELANLIEIHSPKLVIFYSKSYLPDWIQIIGEKPKEIISQMYFIKNCKTSFCVIPQGVARGMSYARIYEFAQNICDEAKI